MTFSLIKFKFLNIRFWLIPAAGNVWVACCCFQEVDGIFIREFEQNHKRIEDSTLRWFKSEKYNDQMHDSRLDKTNWKLPASNKIIFSPEGFTNLDMIFQMIWYCSKCKDFLSKLF